MLSLPPRWSVVRSEYPITHPRPTRRFPVTPTPALRDPAAGAGARGRRRCACCWRRGGGRRRGPRRGATVSPAHIALIERRVEALRGLRFRHPVPVAIVSPAQARREGTRRATTAASRRARRRANEELLKLLGLLPRERRPAARSRGRLRRAGRRLLRPAPQAARARARRRRRRRDARARADARAGGPARRPASGSAASRGGRRRAHRAAGARRGLARRS